MGITFLNFSHKASNKYCPLFHPARILIIDAFIFKVAGRHPICGSLSQPPEPSESSPPRALFIRSSHGEALWTMRDKLTSHAVTKGYFFEDAPVSSINIRRISRAVPWGRRSPTVRAIGLLRRVSGIFNCRPPTFLHVLGFSFCLTLQNYREFWGKGCECSV